jgi:hypothetical protein
MISPPFADVGSSDDLKKERGRGVGDVQEKREHHEGGHPRFKCRSGNGGDRRREITAQGDKSFLRMAAANGLPWAG